MPPVVSQKSGEKKDWRSLKEIRRARREQKVLKQLDRKLKEDAAEKSKDILPTLDRPTISIAIPGSILENAQSHELRTYLAGQIARAAGIFSIDEIIVFDDMGTAADEERADPLHSGEDQKCNPVRHSCVQMARILQFLECPQYLRKFFFPLHKDLQYAGLLNPLETPHHLRQTDEFSFREGIVTSFRTKGSSGSIVNVGLLKPVTVDRKVDEGLRVTVQLLPQMEGSKKLRGRLVSPQTPEAATGRYWGYSVRIASTLSAVFGESPHPEGYDFTIGTSDKGKSVDEVLLNEGFPSFKHCLIVFGGLYGLEGAIEADSVIQVDDPALLFDLYLNSCPRQGTRTIRTEEALLISLAILRPHLCNKSS